MNSSVAMQPNHERFSGEYGGEILPGFFEAQADAHPGAVAVIWGETELSYGELEAKANRVARWLRAKGVRRGDRVGLWMARSPELYAALLGVLKAGAAYVPMDPSFPAERAEFILRDCDARWLIADAELKARAASFAGEVLVISQAKDELEGVSKARLSREETGVQPADLAYIIYTSGTTGRPKGVAIEHRSVCHLVRVERELFGVTPPDRVYQGFSVAFDASVEELWLAFCAGAALVPATREMETAGEGLSGLLAGAGVTVLSCVPTLLAILGADIPTVRLLILGGEVCPAELVNRWWRPGRRLFNTYGPTEATVIATCGELLPNRAITIGKAIRGYDVGVFNAQRERLGVGEEGELWIAGIGLARGYVNRPELTAEKFVEVAGKDGNGRRWYRTGDCGRMLPTSEIEFLGRIDSQVKLRGFRVELGEIEAVLMEESHVAMAAVSLREDEPGRQQLAAYVVTRGGAALAEAVLRARLRDRLPPYMMPACFEQVTDLPRLASGKIDRQRLPKPTRRESNGAIGRTPWEGRVAETWRQVFDTHAMGLQDNFFLDLGGHSLLAARVVSELRKHAGFEGISMLDIYQHPTIEKLAAELERRNSMQGTKAHARSKATAIPFWRHFVCGTAQLVSLGYILTFFAAQWLAPYLVYTILVEEDVDFWLSALVALASPIVLYPLMLFIPIALKWLLIGRYRPGAYPLWGWFYFRWWLVTTVEAGLPVGYLTGTPFLGIYLRLMGAKVGRGVHLGSNNFVVYDLLEIGDGASINADANLLGYTVEDGWLKIGRIRVGRNAFVGTRAALRENTVIEDGGALEDLSMLPAGGRIGARETWRGSPAQPVARKDAEGAPVSIDRGNSRWVGVAQGVGLLVFPVLVSAAIFPGIMLMNELNYLDPYYWYLCLSPLVGLSFVVLLCLEIAALKWLLLGRVRAGKYHRQGWFYVRKWFVDQTMDLSLDVLGPLYASVYLIPWYRLLGAKVGKGAEISTASFISPDLLSLGEESFIADSVSLGAPQVRDGWAKIGDNHIGKRTFVGNSAMLPPETRLGDNVLIGCLSVPPEDAADALKPGGAWLGSPAVFLPQRQTVSGFGETETFQPTARLRVMRAFIEFVRVITPSTCFIILLSLMFSALLLLHDNYDLGTTLLFFPPLYIGCGLAATVFTLLAKWALVGRYRAGEKPLWSTFVWRNELVNALHDHLAEPFLVGALTGTPFASWYFRLLGARIGRRVYLETTDFSEFDLVHIGDEAMLNADCTMQTHLFEDRVMKMSTVRIEQSASVGASSLILYDTRMEPGTKVGDLSLLMKGEVLPAGTRWEGVPARARVDGD